MFASFYDDHLMDKLSPSDFIVTLDDIIANLTSQLNITTVARIQANQTTTIILSRQYDNISSEVNTTLFAAVEYFVLAQLYFQQADVSRLDVIILQDDFEGVEQLLQRVLMLAMDALSNVMVAQNDIAAAFDLIDEIEVHPPAVHWGGESPGCPLGRESPGCPLGRESPGCPLGRELPIAYSQLVTCIESPPPPHTHTHTSQRLLSEAEATNTTSHERVEEVRMLIGNGEVLLEVAMDTIQVGIYVHACSMYCLT